MNEEAIKEADALIDAELRGEKKKESPYTPREGWSAVWRHVAPLRRSILTLTTLGVFSAILNGSVPYVTGKFFDTLILLANARIPEIWGFPMWGILLVVWVLLQFTVNIIDWVMRNQQEAVWLRLRLSIEAEAFGHILTLPLAYHKSTHVGGATNVISNAGWRLSATVRSVTTIAPQLLSMLIGISLAWSINHFLALLLIIGVLLYGLILYFMLRDIARRDDLAHRTWNKAWEYASALVHDAEAVKQASTESTETAKIQHLLLNRVYLSWLKLERHWGNVSFWQRIVVFATQLAIFVFSIGLIRSHTISVGELIAINGYSLMFFGPLVQLGHSWQTIQNGITSAVHLGELLDTKPEVYSPANAIPVKPISGNIVFQEVDFRYEQEHPLVLSGLSIDIPAGKVVALVGESGGGKSTTIGLVSAYYFPTEGSVLIDGVDTRDYNLHDLRAQIAIVPQEVTLWNDTIANNIRYGVPSASKDDVARIAKEAHLAEFIDTLPLGYETLVGERGVKLSVGQKQRIAIARAMLRNPKILILDEPTSALDAETEHHVTMALEKLMHGRTTLIIAHRLSTVRRADTILVFEKGHIVESGSHDTLRKKRGGIYRKLLEHQIGLRE